MGEKKTISTICNVLNGFAFKSDKYVSSGTRVIRITNVQKGYVVDDDPKYYPESEMSQLGQYVLRENDLLMSLTGNVGRVGLLTKDLLPAALNQRVACLRIKDSGVLLKYLFYYLNSDLFEKAAIFSASGIAQKNMSTEWLKKVEVPVPSIGEQQRIVDELDLLTGIIDKKNAQLRDLDALTQSIFYEMFGDPSESKYPVAKLSSLATGKLSYGSGASAIIFDGQTRYVRITDIQEDGRLSPDAMSPSQYDAKYLLNDGDILFARSGATVGKTYLYDSKDGNAIYAGYLIRLVPNQEIVLSEYIYHFTRSHYYRAFIASNVQAVAQPNINAQQYGNLSVCVPPISEQKVFAEKMHSLESKRDMIWSSIKDTQTLLDSRMSHYFG